MDIKEFIIKMVSESGSQTAVSRKTGVSQGTINKIVHGDTTPEMGTISKIAVAYGLPISEFIGQPSGPVFSLGPDPVTGDPIYTQKIRLISNVSAGSGGGVCWESTEDWISRPADLTDPEAFAMKVNGDSMAPKYTQGMTVFAAPSSEIHNGDYVVAELQNGERLVKRCRRTNGTIILESVNQSYESIITGEYDIVRMAKITHSKEK